MGTDVMRLPLPGRLRLRWLLVAAAVIALAILLLSLASVPSGPAVRRLAITLPPASPVTAAEIRAAAAPVARGGLFAVNLAAVRARVTALPWVKQAEVRRVWPHTLAITVTPERPIARWGEEALVDASGQIFTPPSLSGFSALPILYGARANASELFEDFRRAERLLAPLGLAVTAFARNPRGEVALTLAGGTRIELGNEDPRAMLARFVTVAAPALATALARAATVDMRYPNGFAVGWKREGQHG